METIYRNVLLLDGKIVNWKTGSTHWDSVESAFNNRQFIQLFKLNPDRFTVASMSADIKSAIDRNNFFVDAEWYKQFELHEDYADKIYSPY